MRPSPDPLSCRPWLIALAVGVMAGWNARAVLTFDFVAFDDDINLLFNPHLGPPGREALEWMFSDSSYMRRYVPLGWLSFSLVYVCAGLSPVGYHAANLLLHAGNAMLVFWILRCLLRRYDPGRRESGMTFAAGAGAAFWALHPMRAETVGWASGLFYGASGFFALCAVLAYFHSRDATTRRAQAGWLLATVLLHTGSVFTYPMSIGLVVVFVLIDWAERARGKMTETRATLVLRTTLISLPAIAAALVSIIAGQRASEFWNPGSAVGERDVTERVIQAFAAWHDYLWRPWWPVGLTPAPTWLLDFASQRLLAGWSVAVLAAITIALILRPRWRRSLLLLWLAHVALLAPMLGLTEKVHFAANRYHYLAAVVLSAAIAFTLVRATGALRRVVLVVTLVVIAALALLQHGQLGIWRDTDTLMQRIVAKADNAAYRSTSYERWVRFHLQQGQTDEARRILIRAVEHEPAEVLAAARAALNADPATSPRANPAATLHHTLALAFNRRGRPDEAGEHFRAALALAPAYDEAGFNYAMFLARHGDARAALHLYLNRIALAPTTTVPAAARARLLAVVAETFFAQRQAQLALRATDLAFACLAAETADREASFAAGLQVQRQRYEAAATHSNPGR
jgi:Tfp pilus assembly protein PilF